MPIEYTDNGIITQNITEIINEREEFLATLDSLGEDFAIDKTTPIGNMELADANSELSIHELILLLVSSMDVNTARGRFLDYICYKNRIYRIEPQYTTLDLVVHGTPYTRFGSGDITVQDTNSGIYYNLNPPSDRTLQIGEDGTAIMNFKCQYYGPYSPLSTSKFEILTPKIGLDNVSIDYENANISIGRNWETDEELRRRRNEAIQQNSSSIIESIKANLFSVDGVSHVKYIENDTERTDEYGIPMKSFEMIVNGGEANDVANAIYLKKPVGTRAYGTTNVNIIDEENDVHVIGFTRPQNVEIGMKITLRFTDRQSNTLTSNIQEAIKEQFDNIQNIGASIKSYDFIKVITGFSGISDIENIKIYKKSDTETMYDKLPISKHEIAQLDINDIFITES